MDYRSLKLKAYVDNQFLWGHKKCLLNLGPKNGLFLHWVLDTGKSLYSIHI